MGTDLCNTFKKKHRDDKDNIHGNRNELIKKCNRKRHFYITRVQTLA